MRTIQEVGLEILNNQPASFYVFTGPEYGVKQKYIQTLAEHYGSQESATSVKELLDFMSVKHFIPPKPTVYVVRYDDEFISTLADTVKAKIRKINIIGTIVCIYESDKQEAKLDKYLGEYTVRIDNIDAKFKLKYLKSEFPNLSDRLMKIAAVYGTDYQQARNLCRCMQQADDTINQLSDADILRMFGKSHMSSANKIKLAVAARNYKVLLSLLDNYPDQLDSIFYTILSTMIELEKLLDHPKAQSDIKSYVNLWTKKDIYNMYMNTYSELQKLRSYATDAKSRVIHLVSLLLFKEIPSVEDLL